jgi:hypothetical protein
MGSSCAEVPSYSDRRGAAGDQASPDYFCRARRSYFHAKLAFSDGGMNLKDGKCREADKAREALHWMGTDPGHVIFEPEVAEHLRECGRQQGDRLHQHEQ